MPKSQLTRSSILKISVFVLLLMVVCCSISYLTVAFFHSDKEWKHDAPHGHAWLHNELELTESEAAKIDLFEEPYHNQRKALEQEFESRINDLNIILARNNSYTEEVTQAVHGIHEIHGDLQKLAINHYFDMLNALPAEKQEKLRALAKEALSRPK